jgi:hypothetical protein
MRLMMMKTPENHLDALAPTPKAVPTRKPGLLPASRDAIAQFRERVEAELYQIRLAKSAFARW